MSAIRVENRFFPSALRSRAEELLPAAAGALQAIRDKTCQGSEWTGWFDWPAKRGFGLAKDVASSVQSLGVPYDLVLVIGIGGSYLGTRAVADALSHSFGGVITSGGKAKPYLAYAGQHLSEQGILDVLDLLDQRQPIINVISKSGTTTEPGVVFRVVRTYMEKRFGKAEAARRIIATTDPASGALRRLAKDLNYKTFEVPPDVGGRYSVLTAVGLVPLALAGFDIEALLTGADAFFKDIRQHDGGPASENLGSLLRYAASRQASFEAGKRIDLLAYNEPKMASMVEWWKQLFGESEGKEGLGLFPAGLAYTTDLHSLGQYVQEGCRNLTETFMTFDAGRRSGGPERRLRIPHTPESADELGYLEDRYIAEINEAAMQGTRLAHTDGGVPCMTLRVPSLDEQGLGMLIAFFETACGVSAGLLGVNPYDQPGVEAYKKNLFALLGKPGFESLGTSLRQLLARP